MGIEEGRGNLLTQDVDALVTDSGLPEASVAELRAAGMRVEVALFQHKTT